MQRGRRFCETRPKSRRQRALDRLIEQDLAKRQTSYPQRDHGRYRQPDF